MKPGLRRRLRRAYRTSRNVVSSHANLAWSRIHFFFRRIDAAKMHHPACRCASSALIPSPSRLSSICIWRCDSNSAAHSSESDIDVIDLQSGALVPMGNDVHCPNQGCC